MKWQIWEGDLYLYTVYTEAEADEAFEAGFNILAEKPQDEEIYSPYWGA